VIALIIAIFFGAPLGRLFVSAEDAEIAGQVVSNVRLFLIITTAFYFPLALVNIIRFMIQGIGFPTFAILAGVMEMIARALAGFLLVPRFGFPAAALGSPIAWIFADAFLIPAFFHVYRKLKVQLGEEAD
jgi:Na+-driven multidrug efflux pump